MTVRRDSVQWLAGLVCGLALWDVQAQSLTEVVQQALASYPALAATQARTDAARADIDRARSAHYPQISLGAGVNSYASGSMPASLGHTSLSPSARLNLWSGGGSRPMPNAPRP